MRRENALIILFAAGYDYVTTEGQNFLDDDSPYRIALTKIKKGKTKP